MLGGETSALYYENINPLGYNNGQCSQLSNENVMGHMMCTGAN